MKLTELLGDIANAIRDKDGSTEPIQATKFPERIRGISGGSGGENGQAKVEAKVRTTVEVLGVEYNTHMLFNGVRLPRIPFGTGDYPYAFIKQNNSNGYYELYLTTTPNWFSDSYIAYSRSTTRKPYRVAIANAETTTEWESRSITYDYVLVNDTNPLLWSSHDIPNGSVDATDIYFEGTDPVPVD